MFSRTTAWKSSTLLGKYKNKVPLDTPARAATASTVVAAKPFSTNKLSAAASNSPGRASLRRLRRGVVSGARAACDILMTEWLLIIQQACDGMACGVIDF